MLRKILKNTLTKLNYAEECIEHILNHQACGVSSENSV